MKRFNELIGFVSFCFLAVIYLPSVTWAASPLRGAYEERLGGCMRLLYEVFSQDKKTYRLGSDLLLNGSDKERTRLLSICHAFHDRPTDLADHVREVVAQWQQRPVFEKPLHNGTVYPTLPVHRNYLLSQASGGQIAQYTDYMFALGDFIDVDNDGSLDYVISVYFNGNPLPAGYYYRATFINVGNGWTMNHCESNILPNVFIEYFAFLGVPCE